ncbi:hypothetical protein CMO93_05935 [Candidatus Woesearchaeota archaeon]|nr:hypothetical protein [Candidatus Woesearchaeota archaeon]
MVKIKKYLLILGIISLFLIAACEQQTTTSQVSITEEDHSITEEDHEHGVDDVHEEDEDSSATMEVPAEGHEHVQEMVVVEANSQVKEFDMTAKQWEFIPSTITVNEGDTVKLNINNIDVTHGFRIAEFGVSERLSPGKTTTVEFTADKVGEYTFFCSVPCGSGHGAMNGKLIVE